MKVRLRKGLMTFFSGLVCAAAVPAQGADAIGAAAAYPTKPIRLIVPYPPGGSVDFTGREVAQKLTDAWKVQVVIDKINAELNKALSVPEFGQRLMLQGVEPVTSTPQGFHDMIASELARWTKVIKDAGISVESARGER